jgi:hypothetical protein
MPSDAKGSARSGAANHPLENVFSAVAESRTSLHRAPAGGAIADSAAPIGEAAAAMDDAKGGAATLRISATTKAARMSLYYRLPNSCVP